MQTFLCTYAPSHNQYKLQARDNGDVDLVAGVAIAQIEYPDSNDYTVRKCYKLCENTLWCKPGSDAEYKLYYISGNDDTPPSFQMQPILSLF